MKILVPAQYKFPCQQSKNSRAGTIKIKISKFSLHQFFVCLFGLNIHECTQKNVKSQDNYLAITKYK